VAEAIVGVIESGEEEVMLTQGWNQGAVGYGRYGMANGACAYFGRPLAGIDLAQAALLAGMPQAPSAYDPLLHPDAAAARRSQVLDAMVDTGRVSSADAAAAEREPVATSDPDASCLSK